MDSFKDCWIVICWFNFVYCGYVWSTIVEEGCIWTGSGLPHQDTPSVISTETSCHQGELYWTDPFGGLRVTFHPRKVQSEFKICFTSRHQGVNIYKEELNSLTLLATANENVTEHAVCIKGKAEQWPVLYLETQEYQTLTQVNYTVFEHGRKRPRHRRIKECRPCKYSKLVESLCRGDFVVRGYIHPLFPVGNGQKEPANIIATELIRQEKNIFVKSKETGDKFRALVEVPAGCHWKQMEKIVFLLTGNLESGKGPVLQCHIKEEVWVKLKKETILNLCGLVHVKAKLKEAKTF